MRGRRQGRGLLHDFCPYDFSEETPTGERQVFYHPKAAAENSSRHFEISRKEREAILTHMFPLGPVPTNREGWIISFADKICAVMEVCNVAIAPCQTQPRSGGIRSGVNNLKKNRQLYLWRCGCLFEKYYGCSKSMMSSNASNTCLSPNRLRFSE